MAALRDLCHAMVRAPGVRDLGIAGFPAEMGLYLTVLAALGLHGSDEVGAWGFRAPPEEGQGASLGAVWQVLENGSGRTLAEVFDEWRRPPFGMKAGVMPVIALAYALGQAPDLDVAFLEEGDREAARNMMDLLAVSEAG